MDSRKFKFFQDSYTISIKKCQEKLSRNCNSISPLERVALNFTERSGYEIDASSGCDMQDSTVDRGLPDCLKKCMKRISECIAFSFNTVTKLCRTAATCNSVQGHNSSGSSTFLYGIYYISLFLPIYYVAALKRFLSALSKLR